jgi:UV DNA damage endonuclease
MTIGRIGFCCKFLDSDECTVPELNNRGTTVAWLNRQPRAVSEQRLWDIMQHNIRAAELLVERVSKNPKEMRMVRLGSDILPMFTEPTWGYFWQQPDVQTYAERHLRRVGERARAGDVRVSFHPGQFTVLASDSDDIVRRSIEEFEYHATMARWMGYGQRFQDFKINVHISGRRGPAGIRAAYTRLSPEARNCITIENEEITWGLDDCLELADLVPIVLDIHHHNIHSGEYIEADDPRIQRVIDSWRGVRPAIHYSTSREDYLVEHSATARPDLNDLLSRGYRRAKLRAHSDYMWNHALNDWALTHGTWADIQVESKMKNLASTKLYEHYLRSAQTSHKYSHEQLATEVSNTTGKEGSSDPRALEL